MTQKKSNVTTTGGVSGTFASSSSARGEERGRTQSSKRGIARRHYHHRHRVIRVSIMALFLLCWNSWFFHRAGTGGSGAVVAFNSVAIQSRSTVRYYRLPDFATTALSSTPKTQTEFASSPLDEVEQTVTNVLEAQERSTDDDSGTHASVLNQDVADREAIGIVKHLQRRIDFLTRTNSCRRCWLHRDTHCVCQQCPPLEGEERVRNNDDDKDGGTTTDNNRPLVKVRRLFLLQHHKEIGMVVDTAKFITAAFPETCRLVVNGIGPEHQPSMREMLDSIHGGKCLVLFPAEGALTFQDLVLKQNGCDAQKVGNNSYAHRSLGDDGEMVSTSGVDSSAGDDGSYDLIVIDGTWSQARKMDARYIPLMQKGGPQRVCLSEDALKILGGGTSGRGVDGDDEKQELINGHQLRRHSIEWKKVSTFEAARLFLRDMDSKGQHKEQWDVLARYQKIGDNAAMRQLGPPRYPGVEAYENST